MERSPYVLQHGALKSFMRGKVVGETTVEVRKHITRATNSDPMDMSIFYLGWNNTNIADLLTGYRWKASLPKNRVVLADSQTSM